MVATGAYEVQESGLVWKHNVAQQSEPTPTTPQEFLNDFSSNFELRVLERPSPDHLVLEFNHVDVSFVNALRRILLSEIPTVAIEMIYMLDNTSIIHDEVLAHRMGLIPIHFDARRLQDYEDEPTDRNTVVFRLSVSCTAQDVQQDLLQQQRQQQRRRDDNTTAKTEDQDQDSEDEGVVDPTDDPALHQATTQAARTKRTNTAAIPKRPFTKHVYSGDLIWVPQGDQEERFQDVVTIRPVFEDILIAKLRPGQTIELEAHARKGIGKDHAKYSPVATASYRLYTEITLLEPIYDDLAEELVHLYEPGVFELVPCSSNQDPSGTKVKAKVCNPYACTMSRNYMRNPQLAKSIRMVRIPDRFIFSIESVGMHPPAVLLGQALKVLQGKCQRLQDLADQTIETTGSA